MRRKLSCWLVLCSSIVCSKAVHAQSWQALSGAESPDHAVQVIAFLPNEMWIHKDDTITWSFPTPEPHSVTFLTPGQVRPTFTVGCPGTTPDGGDFNNSTCVNSGRITMVGTSYKVKFPKPGNYRLVCLVHANSDDSRSGSFTAASPRSGVLRYRGSQTGACPTYGSRRGASQDQGRRPRRVRQCKFP